MIFRSRRTWPLVLCAVVAVALWLLLPDAASALETQLAGIRLGDHATHLMDVHGVPDGIVVGTGGAAEPGAGGAVGGGAVGVGGPGELAFPSPLGGGPGVRRPASIGGGGDGDDEDEEDEGDEDEDEEDGGGPSVGRGGGAAGGGAFPTWALPLWVPLRPDETMWVYNGSKDPKCKSPVVIAFVLDRDGFVTLISIAGERCSYAATAGNDPEKRIVLGDRFEDVLLRYDWPDEFVPFSAVGGQVAQPFTGEVGVSFAEGGNLFARDLVLRYRERSNVVFTLHNMFVTRIHIWSTE